MLFHFFRNVFAFGETVRRANLVANPTPNHFIGACVHVIDANRM